MPKKVDYEQRRRMVIEAVYSLADERGLDGVNLRDVAARAGVSLGAVQRSFRNKDEMLKLALVDVSEKFSARVQAAVSESSPAALISVITDVALLAADQRREAQIWLAFVARAVVTPAMAEILQAAYTQVREELTGMIGELTGAAGATAGAGADLEARTLLAMADGLTLETLLGQIRREEAREILEAYTRACLKGDG